MIAHSNLHPIARNGQRFVLMGAISVGVIPDKSEGDKEDYADNDGTAP